VLDLPGRIDSTLQSTGVPGLDAAACRRCVETRVDFLACCRLRPGQVKPPTCRLSRGRTFVNDPIRSVRAPRPMSPPAPRRIPSQDDPAEDPRLHESVATRRCLLGRAAIGLGAFMLPAFGHADPLARPGERSSELGSFYSNFRGMQLQDQDGRRFDPAVLLGRTVLVNFVFTGCSTVCPVQTSALAQVQRTLPLNVRSRVRLLSVSLDPLGDTPQRLKAFALSMGVDLSGWSFVTGRPNDIERVSDALRLFRPSPDVRKPEDHATGLWMIDRSGQVRLRYDGNPPDVKRLLREIPVLDELTRRSGA
jgi:protein SCO1/2